jgi:hypothetical protein
MALDKLVDSGKLDAALGFEAGKIRAKTGGSAQLAFDLANEKGFGDAIAAIPSYRKETYSFTPSSSGVRTHTFQNPRAPEIPKLIVVRVLPEDMPETPKTMTVHSGGDTLFGPASNANGFDNYNNYEYYYDDSGNFSATYSYAGGYRNGISDDRETIRVGVRSQTGSVFKSGVTYTVELYYW